MDGLRGARVLVTGANGFLGKHVINALGEAGAVVMAVYHSWCDLTLEARAMAPILKGKPDVVIHLAAPPIDASPATRVRDTLLMGLNVITACSIAETKLLLVNPRGVLQEALLEAAQAHRTSHQMTFVQVVPCTLYGPWDHFDGIELPIVPTFFSQLHHAAENDVKKIKLYGLPQAKTDLLHVSDAAQAILKAAQLPGCTQPLPLVGAKPVQLKQLAEAIAKLVGFKGDIEWVPAAVAAPPRPTEEGAIGGEVLEWAPQIPLQKGLEETYHWKFSAPKPMKEEPAKKEATP